MIDATNLPVFSSEIVLDLSGGVFIKLAVVSSNYPSESNPARGTFVYGLVQELCRQGSTVTTIAPRKLWNAGKRMGPYGPELSRVLRPTYVSFSNKTIVPGISTGRMSVAAFTAATRCAMRATDFPDIVYGHFLYPSGFAAVKVAKELEVPCVVALGESSMDRHEKTHGIRAVRKLLHKFSHIITVSSILRDYCVERMGVNPEKVTVVPNAVDTNLFYLRDRRMVRDKLGLPQQAFIVTYLGHFDERKGFARVMAALKRHPQIKAIFIGNGPNFPNGEQVLFAGPVRHPEVPDWLAAGDIFVLPTLAEGHCNAVNEALAVGLPVVVSDIPALREQVDERAAIFVNPRDIQAIADGIGLLYRDTDRRTSMSNEAVRIGQQRSITSRAKRILELLDHVIKHQARY